MSNTYHDMISPQDTALVLIDFQPAMFQGVESHDRLSVVHNVQILAKVAGVLRNRPFRNLSLTVRNGGYNVLLSLKSKRNITAAKRKCILSKVAEAVDFDLGPVMVTICYQIKPHDKQAFLRTIYQLKTVRMRNGVYRWEVFENIEKPGQFLEYFMEDNWAEHLRHHNRVPKQDKILQDQVLAFHEGEEPPKVTHYVSADRLTKI